MREYATVSPKFWMGETGRKLRGDADAQRVAFYLMTCPSSNMIGLYYLPLPTLCHELGSPFEGASKGLRRVQEIGFAYYDTATEWVWVCEMAKYQVGDSLAINDNRVKSVSKMFSECLKSPFAKDFYQRYGKPFHLESFESQLENRSPFEAPSKPLRSQEQEQEQDKDKEQGKLDASTETPKTNSKPPAKPKPEKIRPEPPAETVMTFECDGATAIWHLTQAQIDVWQGLFPTLVIIQECREAMAWLMADPRRRKTADGMMKFLVGWFGRSQNKGGGNGRSTGQTGLFGGSQKADPGRVRTGATGNAIQQAMAEAAAKRGGSIGSISGATGCT